MIRIDQYKNENILIATPKRDGFRRTFYSESDMIGVLASVPNIRSRETYSVQMHSGEYETTDRDDAFRFERFALERNISFDQFYLMPFSRDIKYIGDLYLYFSSAASYEILLTYPSGLDLPYESKIAGKEGGVANSVFSKFNNGYGVMICIYNSKVDRYVLGHVVSSTATIGGDGIDYDQLGVYLLYNPRFFGVAVPYLWQGGDLIISYLVYGNLTELSHQFSGEFKSTTFPILFEENDEYPIQMSTAAPGDGYVWDTGETLPNRYPGKFGPIDLTAVGSPVDVAGDADLTELSVAPLSNPDTLAGGRDSSQMAVTSATPLYLAKIQLSVTLDDQGRQLTYALAPETYTPSTRAGATVISSLSLGESLANLFITLDKTRAPNTVSDNIGTTELAEVDPIAPATDVSEMTVVPISL